ncbi:unnamed protein product [Aureobasidium uvarum]|uniref:BTB domain-containing protein n=1 Tax=Aureobasidium uvarum TaxID=2773716 RepID=A0A9N8KQJ9_9PEZI|nr:unnamed protein product [Aureobasidium uvarum]
MATILVGSAQEKFIVHQELLCSKSEYFAKALTGTFEESQTGIVKLEDVSPFLFRIFVTWLYSGKLAYTVVDDSSNIDQDFGSLDGGFNPAIIKASDLNCEDVMTWPEQAFVALYILADRLDVKALRSTTIDILIEFFQEKRNSAMSAGTYRYINSNTTAASPLRKLVLDRLIYGVRYSSEDLAFWKALPHDMVVTVLIELARRIPSELCSSCHSKKPSYNSIALDDDHSCKDKDTAPYKADPCFYHEHADEEEKKACRARRNPVTFG